MDGLIPVDEAAIQPADRDPAEVYLASLAPSGRRTMAGKLRRVAREILGIPDPRRVPWHLLRFQHVAAIRARLQERGYAPSTVNSVLYAIRGVARAAFHLGLMGGDDYHRLCGVRPVSGQRLPAGRAVTPGELGALMDACSRARGPAGIRDAAIIAVLYAAGLRRSEVVTLDLADHDADSGELRVRGKGNKERDVYVDNGAADALADWRAVRGAAPGPLFLPIDKCGTIHVRRMSGQSVYNVLVRRARQAGVREVSCHDMRRSFVSDLLDAGADISTVSRLAGHANVATSARYDRRGEAAKRQAVALLHVPYRRRL